MFDDLDLLIHLSKHHTGRVWRHMPTITALSKLRQDHCKFEASLDYIAT